MPTPRVPAISGPSVPANQTHFSRILHASAALMILLGAANEASPESTFNPEGRFDAEQFALPWDGPGAASFNPALVTETKRVDGRFGMMSSVSGKGGFSLFQGSVSVPFGISVGFSRFKNGTDIDGSSAVYEEAINTSIIGWGGRDILGSGFDAGVGLAYARHDYNAFGVVRSQVHAFDIGVHAATPALGLAGRLHTGLTLRNLAAGEVILPNDNPQLIEGRYKALLLNIDASFLLKSAFDCVDAYLEFNAHQDSDPSEGPPRDEPSMVKSMGVEYRPIPYAGLKIERTWLKRWTAGLVGHATIPIGEGIELGAEADVSHDKVLSPKDEGRGWLWSMALNAGM